MLRLLVCILSLSTVESFLLYPVFQLRTRLTSRFTAAQTSSSIFYDFKRLSRCKFDKMVMYAAKNNARRSLKGDLKNLPRVFPAPELWARALKRASFVKEDVSIKNPRNRCRKLAAERLSTLSKELTKPLGSFLDGFSMVLSRLPPFETVVVDLTVKHRCLACFSKCSEKSTE